MDRMQVSNRAILEQGLCGGRIELLLFISEHYCIVCGHCTDNRRIALSH